MGTEDLFIRICSQATPALAALILVTSPTWAKPNIPDLARRCSAPVRWNQRSLGQQNACRALAKIALEDKVASIRGNAVELLTDQALLAKIAVDDSDASVRSAAVANLTDRSRALLAKIALDDKDASVRGAARSVLAKVAAEEQASLASIAMGDNYYQARNLAARLAAVGTLSDQALLAKVAVIKNLENNDRVNPQVRRAAVEKLTDQTSLEMVAMKDEDGDVRLAAVGRLTDQTALAKVALSLEFDYDVEHRQTNAQIAAVKKLTDQTVLGKIALQGNMGARDAAVRKLTDQTELARVATQGTNGSVRYVAVQKLTDQTVLAQVAIRDADVLTRLFAIDHLMDQAALAQAANGDPYKGNRLAAIARLTDQVALAAIHAREKGGYRANTEGAEGAAALICLALQDPVVVARMPNAKLATSYRQTSQAYERGPIRGENISFSIRQASRVLASGFWATSFPQVVEASTVSRTPLVDVSGMLRELVAQPEFAREDLVKLAQSEIPEVQAAASAWYTRDLTDNQLAKAAVENKDDHIRMAAIKRLTDQALLAQIAVGDKDPPIRQAAAERLTDKALLAKIATQDKDPAIREAAEHRLTELWVGKH